MNDLEWPWVAILCQSLISSPQFQTQRVRISKTIIAWKSNKRRPVLSAYSTENVGQCLFSGNINYLQIFQCFSQKNCPLTGVGWLKSTSLQFSMCSQSDMKRRIALARTCMMTCIISHVVLMTNLERSVAVSAYQTQGLPNYQTLSCQSSHNDNDNASTRRRHNKKLSYRRETARQLRMST